MSTEPKKKSSAISMPVIANAAEIEKEYQEKFSSHLSNQKTKTRRSAKNEQQKERAGPSANTLAANKDEGGRKKESDFAVLFRTLVDASTIAAYIAQQHNNDLRNVKSLNNFLQSISQRPAEIYSDFFANHKGEVSAVLERLLDSVSRGGNATTSTATTTTSSSSNTAAGSSSSSAGGGAAPTKKSSSATNAMTPAAHELVIRAKAAGVGRKAWEAEAAPLPDAVQSGMTTRQVIKALIAVDPKGHLMRMVELANNADKILDTIGAIAGSEDATINEKVVVLTRLLSKTRGLLDEGKDKDEEEKEEDKEKGDKKEEEGGVEGGKKRKSKAERRAEKVKSKLDNEPSITAEQSKEVVKQLLDLSYDVFVRGKIAATGKYTKFAEWAKGKGLIEGDYDQVLARIEEESNKALLTQANNLELLLTLKSGNVTKDAFKDVLAGLSDEENNVFTTTGVDVLSAIAVTAAKFSEDAELMESIVERLVNTHKASQGTLQLPRRVMTFIAAQRQKKEQAEVAEFRKKREREDEEKFGGADVNPNKARRKEKKAVDSEYVEEEL